MFAQAGERLIIDVCTHCECLVEDGAVKKYKLSCKRFSCPPCPLVTTISFPVTDRDNKVQHNKIFNHI